MGWSDRLVGAPTVSAVAAGLALGASFIDFRLWGLPWVAVAPLIVIAESSRSRRAFRLGWIGGVVGLAMAFSWLVHAFRVFGGFSLVPAVILFLAPISWMALQLGLFCGALAWLGPLPLGLAAPITYVAIEFLFPTLFPWRLGNTQYRLIPLLQSGELAGPFLLDFVIVWVNAGLVLLLRDNRRGPLTAALASTLLVGVYGVTRVTAVESDRAIARSIRVGVVQGNIGVERKGDRSFFRRNLDDYRRLSAALAPEVDLLIWPETVVQRPIAVAARVPSPEAHPFPDSPRPLVFGGLAIDDSGPERRLYNSAFLLDAAGEIAGRYDKRILVPFGEYLPFADWLPWLRRVSPASGHFTAGTRPNVLIADGNVRVGPLICYEDVIPGPARAAVAAGAQLLLNLTNDAWYGDSAEPLQHQALAVWRAVETRRDFVRSTNTGLTAVTSATGTVLAVLPVFTEGAAAVEVRLLDGTTFYARYGDVFAWVVVFSGLTLAVRRLLVRKA